MLSSLLAARILPPMSSGSKLTDLRLAGRLEPATRVWVGHREARKPTDAYGLQGDLSRPEVSGLGTEKRDSQAPI
eukprot:1158891-Pelagomonas_calceolata.AAC.4